MPPPSVGCPVKTSIKALSKGHVIGTRTVSLIETRDRGERDELKYVFSVIWRQADA
jgi:hypothetical protein